MKLFNYVLIILVDYNKESFIKAELQYECNLWPGEGLHTTNSLTKEVVIKKNNTIFHLKNDENILKTKCFNQ